MDELVDVVDENDQVIGQKSKYACHSKQILHRGCAVLIFKDDSHQDLLLQKRSCTMTVCPGLFAFTGGHVLSGECYLEAAKKEFKEEMFFSGKMPDLNLERLFKIRKYADNDHEFMCVFRTVYSGSFSLQPSEVASYHFENIHELIKKVESNPEEYTETCRYILKEYCERYL